MHAFKAKLRPERWEPVYLAAPARPYVALGAGLSAFARGSLVRFGVRTLAQRPWLAALALALVVACVALAIVLLA